MGPLWRDAQVTDIFRSQRDSNEEIVNMRWLKEMYALHDLNPKLPLAPSDE